MKHMFTHIAAAKCLSAADKRAIFHYMAVRTYRLDDTSLGSKL